MSRKNGECFLSRLTIEFIMTGSIFFGSLVIPSLNLVIGQVTNRSLFHRCSKCQHNSPFTHPEIFGLGALLSGMSETNERTNDLSIGSPQGKSSDIKLPVFGTDG